MNHRRCATLSLGDRVHCRVSLFLLSIEHQFPRMQLEYPSFSFYLLLVQ